MKRFSFSLQKVLDLREFEKNQAQTELGKAVSEERKIQDTMDMIAQARAASVHEADGMTDIRSLYGVNQYFKLLDQRRDQMATELAKAKLVTEEKRAVMREAMKKVKVLENLREHRVMAWKKQLQKEEDDAIDDIVTSRFKNSSDIIGSGCIDEEIAASGADGDSLF